MAITRILALGLVGTMAAGAALAGPSDNELLIEGQTMITRAPAPAHLEGALGDTVYSGWLFRTPETQDLETDDFANPAMVLVEEAVDNWNKVDGEADKSCASCHDGVESFAGLTATMPKFDTEHGKLMVMEDYINYCRTERMDADAWSWNSNSLQSMVALIALQSRGLPMNVAIDGPAAPYWEQGKEMYFTRYGQLELSCANCHQDHFGDMIRADHLSQGQTNGFPTYRLKNAALVSKHNRFKGCIRDTRAETYKEGTDEFRALELYVASRGNGLSVEAPAVRQ